MQIAVSEFARHVAGMPGANSTEFDIETEWPVIDLLPEQKEVSDLGGTMRLGADPVKLHEGTRAPELYGEAVIYERHRHRYEVSISLRKKLEAAGLVVSGTSPDERLVEIIELHDHPFFVASQFHPSSSRARRSRRRCSATSSRPAKEYATTARSRPPRTRSALLAAASAAGLRGRAPAAERPVRRAVRDPVGVARRARLRGSGDGGAAGLGLEVIEDGAGAEVGANAGNLLARMPGRSERSILLCSHLDTVPHGDIPIEPVVEDGGWINRNEAILGADNKAAVAVMLALAHRIAIEGSPVGVELLFTVCEETALAGAKAFDVSQLRSEFGYTLDHATPIGEVVVASPTVLPDRGHVPWQGRARGAAAGGRAQRDPGGGTRDRCDAARAPRRGDDRERRIDPGRRRRDERRPRPAARCSQRPAR
jgi:hypothetical protein